MLLAFPAAFLGQTDRCRPWPRRTLIAGIPLSAAANRRECSRWNRVRGALMRTAGFGLTWFLMAWPAEAQGDGNAP